MAALNGTYKRQKLAQNDGDKHITVSFSGERLNYTYLAAKSVFSTVSNLQFVSISSCGSVKEVFESVNSGISIYGVVALESSSHGTIHNVYDKLLGYNGGIVIVGEIGMLEQHNLCTKTEISSETDITGVICHPHILECCSDYLDYIDSQRLSKGKSNLQRIGAWDSAAAASQIALNSNNHNEILAAISTKEAAAFHELKVIKNGIGNDQNAETRYIIIAKQSRILRSSLRAEESAGLIFDPSNVNLNFDIVIEDPLNLAGKNLTCANDPSASNTYPGKSGKKTSIALALRNVSGSIFKMASCFALRDIDIIKIESRPAATAVGFFNNQGSESPSLSSRRAYTQKHWDLIFYIDYEPSTSDDVNKALKSNLLEFCLWVRELGTYNSSLQRIDVKPTDWKDVLDVMGNA